MTEQEPPDGFDELHMDILEILKEGRATPAYLAERTGESSQLMNNRLRDLRMASYVAKVHTGLYELNTADDDSTDTEESLPDEPVKGVDEF